MRHLFMLLDFPRRPKFQRVPGGRALCVTSCPLWLMNFARQKKIWSGRRDLNPRLRPWQGRTLPLSYSRSAASIINKPPPRGNADSAQTSIRATCLGLQHGFVRLGRDLVSYIPKFLVEKVLHPLMKYLNRRSHRANHAAADNSLRKFEMMKAKKVYAFIKIQKTLRHIVQAEEFIMPPVNVIHAEIRFAQLGVEAFAKPRADMKHGKKSGRVQPAAVPQSSANNVIVVRSDRFQHMQHRNRIVEHLVGAANQARSIREVAFVDSFPRAIQFPRNPLQQQL